MWEIVRKWSFPQQQNDHNINAVTESASAHKKLRKYSCGSIQAKTKKTLWLPMPFLRLYILCASTPNTKIIISWSSECVRSSESEVSVTKILANITFAQLVLQTTTCCSGSHLHLFLCASSLQNVSQCNIWAGVIALAHQSVATMWSQAAGNSFSLSGSFSSKLSATTLSLEAVSVCNFPF
jgi:hypothetical protein